MDLPKDVWFMCAKFLNWRDLASLARTNRLLREVATSQLLWRPIWDSYEAAVAKDCLAPGAWAPDVSYFHRCLRRYAAWRREESDKSLKLTQQGTPWIKIIVVGMFSVGKTALVHRYDNRCFVCLWSQGHQPDFVWDDFFQVTGAMKL